MQKKLKFSSEMIASLNGFEQGRVQGGESDLNDCESGVDTCVPYKCDSQSCGGVSVCVCLSDITCLSVCLCP